MGRGPVAAHVAHGDAPRPPLPPLRDLHPPQQLPSVGRLFAADAALPARQLGPLRIVAAPALVAPRAGRRLRLLQSRLLRRALPHVEHRIRFGLARVAGRAVGDGGVDVDGRRLLRDLGRDGLQHHLVDRSPVARLPEHVGERERVYARPMPAQRRCASGCARRSSSPTPTRESSPSEGCSPSSRTRCATRSRRRSAPRSSRGRRSSPMRTRRFCRRSPRAFQMEMALPGDWLVREGGVLGRLVFVDTGLVEVLVGAHVTEMGDGSYFGEISAFELMALSHPPLPPLNNGAVLGCGGGGGAVRRRADGAAAAAATDCRARRRRRCARRMCASCTSCSRRTLNF